MSRNYFYAVSSGICAAAASIFGKLCGLSNLQDFLFLRIALFLLMILCNAGVFTLFVKALQSSESSLSATVTSTASNYLFSAVAGFLIFDEATSLFWWSGILLVLFGLILIVKDQIKDIDDILEESRKD